MSELIKSVFINRAFDTGWIIEKLMSDIEKELKLRGVIVHSGFLDYDQQDHYDVVFHERFFYATKYKNTSHNSAFLTHIDDKIKEKECFDQLSWLDSCICMSPDQAAQLKNNPKSVFVNAKISGISLPPRNDQINPITFAILSNNYSDDRKNSSWLLELIKKMSTDQKKLLIIKIVGEGWAHFAKQIKSLGVSVELVNYDRKMPNEYSLVKNHLIGVDYCIYMGLDGGAMSIYDSIELGIKVIYPRNCYHIGLEDAGHLFSSKMEFSSIFIDKVNKRLRLQNEMQERSIVRYVDTLLHEWFGSVLEHDLRSNESEEADSHFSLHQSFHKLTLRRFLGHLKRRLYKSIFK